MNYANFRQWRDEVISDTSSILRLDCMNPGKALASWINVSQRVSKSLGEITPDKAIELWSELTNQYISKREVVLAKGVRDLLGGSFGHISQFISEIWIPEDVYPVYLNLTETAGFSPRSFQTLPEIQLSFLSQTGSRAAILIPIPLSPAGRWLSNQEIELLIQWLKTGDRILLIDAVYTYDFLKSRAILKPLLATGRCSAFWSCSKSWLRSNTFGIASVPKTWASSIQSNISPPSREVLKTVISFLEVQPKLPLQQAHAFQKEWTRLSETIQTTMPKWQPPDTGYFSIVTVSHEKLLTDYNILSIPATVFGGKKDLSVVSCLYDLTAHQSIGNI